MIKPGEYDAKIIEVKPDGSLVFETIGTNVKYQFTHKIINNKQTKTKNHEN